MKNIYIALILLSGTGMVYAQQNKIAENKQETKENSKYQNEDNNTLPSEIGLKKETASKTESVPQGNLIPGTSDIEKIKSTIPGRKQNQPHSSVTKKTVNGLPNTATLEEIKKTISD